MQPDRAARVQVESLGEHEAHRRLVDGARVRGSPLPKVDTLDHRPQPAVGREDREQVDRADAAAVVGAPGEHQAHTGAGRHLDLRQPCDIVEVDGAGEPEGAPAGDDRITRAHGPAEVAVRGARASRTRQQAEDGTSGETREQRDAHPRDPPTTELRVEPEHDRGHRATLTGDPDDLLSRPHVKLHARQGLRCASEESRVYHASRRRHRLRREISVAAVVRAARVRDRRECDIRARACTNRFALVGVEELRGVHRSSSQLYGQALAAGGAHVTFSEDVGATEVAFAALKAGTFDAYADYQGTLLTYLGGAPTANSATTHAALVEKLRGSGITVSRAAPAVDVNGFYVTRKTAARYHLSKVYDLRKVAPRCGSADHRVRHPPALPR